jgi:hypothetical protein
MPQFDQFSFLNQVSWFLFFFFNFYFFISYFFLPKISHNIKFRKKTITLNVNKKIMLNLEKKNKNLFINNLYKNYYNKFEFFIKKNMFIYNINQNKFLLENPLINQQYIQKMNHFLNTKFILSKKFLFNI